MKKIILIITAVFLNATLFSCTEEDEIVKNKSNLEKPVKQACCGDDVEILPPPPPSKGGN